MGTIIIDKDGQADLAFHNIPLYTVKKATFRNVAGVLYDLLKMTVNSVTYNFAETAQNGAVVLSRKYDNWDFVAPDGRLDFDALYGQSLSEAFDTIQTTAAANPIPAWESFAKWVYDQSAYPKYIVSQCTAYIRPVNGSYTPINAPDFTTLKGTTFSEFMTVLKTAVSDTDGADLPMSQFKTGDTSFACDIMLNRNDSTLIVMRFTFRE